MYNNNNTTNTNTNTSSSDNDWKIFSRFKSGNTNITSNRPKVGPGWENYNKPNSSNKYLDDYRGGGGGRGGSSRGGGSSSRGGGSMSRRGDDRNSRNANNVNNASNNYKNNPSSSSSSSRNYNNYNNKNQEEIKEREEKKEKEKNINDLIQLSIEAKEYFKNRDVIQKYLSSTGLQVVVDLKEFVEKQSDINSYMPYQPRDSGGGGGGGSGGGGKNRVDSRNKENISYLYAGNKSTVFVLLVYNFMGLGNPDINPILENLTNSNSNNWSRNIQGQESLVTNYNFLNKVTWLAENVSQEIFDTMYLKLTLKGVNPFIENQQKEDSFGSLMSCYSISSTSKLARLNTMLLMLPENIAEVTLRSIINKGVNNWEKKRNNMLLKYLYNIHPEVFCNLVVENLNKLIDLPRGNVRMTSISNLIKLCITIIGFGSTNLSNLSSFDKVNEYYVNIINNRERTKYKKTTSNSSTSISTTIRVCWDEIIGEYYFGAFGSSKNLDEKSGVKLVVSKIFSCIEVCCKKYSSKEINETRCSWSLECLIAGVCEIFKYGELYDKITSYLISIFDKDFDMIPINVKVKIVIRSLVHCFSNNGKEEIVDNKLVTILLNLAKDETTSTGTSTSDKATVFLIEDFLKSVKRVDTTSSTTTTGHKEEEVVVVEEVEVDIEFTGLELKVAHSKSINVWLEDIVYKIELSCKNNIEKNKLAEALMRDLCYSVDSSKIETCEHIITLLNSKSLLSILDKKMLLEGLNSFKLKVDKEDNKEDNKEDDESSIILDKSLDLIKSSISVIETILGNI